MCSCGAIFDAKQVADAQSCPECGRPPDLWTLWDQNGATLRD